MWSWAVFFPHAPVALYEVGKGAEGKKSATLAAYARAAKEISGLKPERVLLLCPHLPYAINSLYVSETPDSFVSFARFGAPEVAFDVEGSVESAVELNGALVRAGVDTGLSSGRIPQLDHASSVSLYFLRKAWGGSLPPVVFANPVGMSPRAAYELGVALRGFDDGCSWGLLASGDLSHSVGQPAPNGCTLDGEAFDQMVVEAFETGDPARLLALPLEEIEGVAECGLRSALALLGFTRSPVQVFSHEAPFGVGYCVAHWAPEASAQAPSNTESKPEPPEESVPQNAPQDQKAQENCENLEFGMELPPEQGLASLARAVLAAHFDRKNSSPAATQRLFEGRPAVGELTKKAACFVTLHMKSGDLRGCIGTLEPVRERLYDEIVANALSAAFHDPRFPPLSRKELGDLTISVDVLSPPEPVTDARELDPKVWGVIVSKGGRRGVLLPDLEGVDSVDQQLRIAASKAGIGDLSGVKIQKFRVVRHHEHPAE